MKVVKESLTIEYPMELLLSLKESKEKFEREARLLLAAKLFELEKISSMSRDFWGKSVFDGGRPRLGDDE